MSSGVRQPIAAGTLYAADPQQLRVDIDAAINGADTEFAGPKVLVVPDCGLTSAPDVAGTAMLMLESERDHVQRVVLIADHVPGPGERSFAGIAIPKSIAFRTPLGDLLVDRAALDQISDHPVVVANDRPFEFDDSLEVHLPAIQRLLGNIAVVPVLVGEAETRVVVDVLERLWGGRETLVLVSTALATGDSEAEVATSGEAARASVRANDVGEIADGPASSGRTLAALAAIASRRSMGLHELAYSNGPDTRRPRGFSSLASFGAWESSDIALAEADVAHLRSLARAAIDLTVLGGQATGTDAARVPPALAERRASVVTLRRNGQTRGSAGSIEADRSLAASIVRNASAACADPRLPSVQPSELVDLEVTISLVSPITRVFASTWEELAGSFTPGRHGVLVTSTSGRAAQLPTMWARYATPANFIGAVAEKAGLDVSMRVAAAAWYRFETLEY